MPEETPDEKLLKFIEGGAEMKLPRKVGIKPKKPARLGLPLVRPKLIFTLPNLNMALFVAAALLTAYFFYAFIRGSVAINADLFFTSLKSASVHPGAAAESKNGLLPQGEYLSEVSKRNIFFPAGEKSDAAAEADLQVTELVKDLKVVGILWSDNPEAMIEDKNENRTYLLKKGAPLGQYLKIKDILRNSVILEISWQDKHKEYELK